MAAAVESPPPLSVLMVASEAQPYAKTGGLADVVGALAPTLARLGHQVTVVLPHYREIGPQSGDTTTRTVRLGPRSFDARLTVVAAEPGLRWVLVGCDGLYDRDGLYGDHAGDFADNATRFGLLARVALDWAERSTGLPDVIHAHDWQAGLVPVWLHTASGSLAEVPSLFTIHNLAYQGLFPTESLDTLGLPRELFSIDGLEFWGQISFLKGGLVFADGITTVSRTYAREILGMEQGEGLDGLLRHREAVLSGIPNGIDVEIWDPARDRFLPRGYSADDLSGKRAAKAELLARYGLPTDPPALARPLIGMVSRMVDQKGLDLIRDAKPRLDALDATFTIVGSGADHYEEMWRARAAERPDRVGVVVGFDESLAHLVEAGADLFLMPSRYEPCGLNQMYSMRYGTVPVVRATGGLADTVTPYDAASGSGTGFVFDAYSADAMVDAIEAALDVFRQPERWRTIQRAGMRQDFSWDVSAAAYVQRYRDVIERRQAAGTAGGAPQGV